MYQRPDLYLTNGLWDFTFCNVEAHADRVALQIFENGRWNRMTYRQLLENDIFLGSYLQENHPETDHIAILMEGRPEWVVSFFGSAKAGKKMVLLDTKLNTEELLFQVNHSESQLILASDETEAAAEKLAGKSKLPCEVINVQKLLRERPFVQPLQAIEPDMESVCLLTYTSGTTGNPKAVALSYRNVFFVSSALSQGRYCGTDDRFVSILPLNHTFELQNGILTPLRCGSSVTFVKSIFPQDISQTLERVKATRMTCVPLFLKVLRKTIESQLSRQPKPLRAIVRLLQATAKRVPSHAVRRWLMWPVNRTWGGRLQAFFVGGAPLPVGTAKYFDDMGIHVLQGYGLSETGPNIASNTFTNNRIGSVGQPLPGVEVYIEKENPKDKVGEILVRGANIMVGYHKNPTATKDVIDSKNVFRTGDLGYLDNDSYLYITGRKKNLVVLGGGKKVYPEELEEHLDKLDYIEEAAVFGHSNGSFDSETIVAVVKIDSKFAAEVEKDGNDPESHFRKDIQKHFELLTDFKRPQNIVIVQEPLPKTSTRKVKVREVKVQLGLVTPREIAGQN